MRLALVFRGFIQRQIVDGREHDEEQAHEVTCVVVAVDEDRERCCIEVYPSLQKQSPEAEHYERQEHHGITPHDVPEVRDIPSAQGICRCENNSNVVYPLVIVGGQEHRHEHRSETGTDAGDDPYEYRDRLGRGKYREQVERARRVVGISGIVFLPEAVIPAVEQ